MENIALRAQGFMRMFALVLALLFLVALLAAPWAVGWVGLALALAVVGHFVATWPSKP